MTPAVMQAVSPNWMPAPESWMWRTPARQRQGFGVGWRANPGLANLLWLVMDRATPPSVFDARTLPDYLAVVAGANTSLRTLVELAEINSLPRFHRTLSTWTPASPMHHRLLQLAARRLNAHV